MKKIKYLMFVLVISLIFIPSSVFAKTKEEAESMLNSMALENADGSCTWNFEITDPDVMVENYCNYSLNDLIKDHPWLENVSYEQQLETLDSMKKSCRLATVESIVEIESRKFGYPNWSVGVDLSNGVPIVYDDYDINLFDSNKLSLTATYESTSEYGYEVVGTVLKTCKVEINEIDENVLKSVSKVVKKFEANNVIYSLTSFNSVYHYGKIFENNTIDSEMILYKFPEFKQSLMDNPEYDYEIAWFGGGGTPIETGCGGYVIAYKDGVPYGLRYVNFSIDNRLYVDKSLDGTSIEKAYDRLNKFFNGKVDIKFDSDTYEENYDIDGITGLFTYVNLGNVETPIFIVEVDKKDLDDFEVKAHNKKYNVNVISNSYDVPIDATLEVKDVMKNITLDTNEYRLLGAYDIDVIKTGTGSYVKNVENGIDVYIPVSNRKIGEKLKVIHMEENNKQGDEFEGEVVEIDGVQYVKFRTTHFSTYAVVDDTSAIANPDTGDDVIYSVVLAVLSISGLFVVYKLRPKYE